MKSKFTELILQLKKIGMSEEDINTIVENRVSMLQECDRIREQVKGPDAREQALVDCYEMYNEYEDAIYAKYN